MWQAIYGFKAVVRNMMACVFKGKFGDNIEDVSEEGKIEAKT